MQGGEAHGRLVPRPEAQLRHQRTPAWSAGVGGDEDVGAPLQGRLRPIQHRRGGRPARCGEADRGRDQRPPSSRRSLLRPRCAASRSPSPRADVHALAQDRRVHRRIPADPLCSDRFVSSVSASHEPVVHETPRSHLPSSASRGRPPPPRGVPALATFLHESLPQSNSRRHFWKPQPFRSR